MKIELFCAECGKPLNVLVKLPNDEKFDSFSKPALLLYCKLCEACIDNIWKECWGDAKRSFLHELISFPLTDETVQQCCLCYGGNSFPDSMRKVLEYHLQILGKRGHE